MNREGSKAVGCQIKGRSRTWRIRVVARRGLPGLIMGRRARQEHVTMTGMPQWTTQGLQAVPYLARGHGFGRLNRNRSPQHTQMTGRSSTSPVLCSGKRPPIKDSCRHHALLRSWCSLFPTSHFAVFNEAFLKLLNCCAFFTVLLTCFLANVLPDAPQQLCTVQHVITPLALMK